MVKSKAIGVIVVIVVIIVVYALSQGQEDVSNEESIESAQDSSVSDSVTLTQNNPDYEVDEEGNKRYTITVGDSPVLED